VQRITDATAAGALPAPPVLTGPVGYFTGGLAGITPATRVRYWWLNMLQEEMLALLAAAGIAPDTTATVFTQVLQAILALPGKNVQIFTASGTFTVPPNVYKIKSTAVGGGGGGGGSSNTGSGSISTAPGGASGTAGWGLYAVTPGATYPVTIGPGGSGGIANGSNGSAGGTSSFGSLISAPGGSGSFTSPSFPGAQVQAAVWGAAICTGGIINGGSRSGQASAGNSSGNVFGGGGGDGPFGGGGGQSIGSGNSVAGNPAVSWGSGGGGACCGSSETGQGGGDGSGGIVIVEW
jgi:hypothetical protein